MHFNIVYVVISLLTLGIDENSFTKLRLSGDLVPWSAFHEQLPQRGLATAQIW